MKTCTCEVVAVLLLAGTVLLFAGGAPEAVPLPKWDILEPIDVETLSKTNISGILNLPVQQGTNQVFCVFSVSVRGM